MSGKSIVLKIVAGLIAVALLVCAIVFLAQDKEAEDLGGNVAIYSRDEESVTRIEVKGEEEYILTKNGDEWEMEGMGDIGINKTFADTLVKSVCNIYSPMKVGENILDLSQYGLKDPAVTVKLVMGNKEEYIYVGNASGEYYYLKTSVDNSVYIVSENDLYMVFLDKIKYLDNTVLAIDPSLITQVQHDRLNLVKQGDDWYETNPYEHLADGEAVNSKILSCFTSVSATEIVKKEDITYEKEALVQIFLSDGTEFEFMVWDNSYIAFFTSDYAYKVNEEDVAFLTVNGFDLLNKYVAPIAISQVTGIEFVSPVGVTKLTIEAPSTEAPVFYKDGVEVSDASFRGFYQSLMGLMFVKEGVAEGAAEYVITFTKESGEVYSMGFISANDSEFAVSINGKSDFMVNKKAVTDIFDALKNIEKM